MRLTEVAVSILLVDIVTVRAGKMSMLMCPDHRVSPASSSEQ